MVELLLVVGSALALSLAASETRTAYRQWTTERETERRARAEAERQAKLRQVRARIELIEAAMGAGEVNQETVDEYDVLLLVERTLEADELLPPDFEFPKSYKQPIEVRRRDE